METQTHRPVSAVSILHAHLVQKLPIMAKRHKTSIVLFYFFFLRTSTNLPLLHTETTGRPFPAQLGKEGPPRQSCTKFSLPQSLQEGLIFTSVYAFYLLVKKKFHIKLKFLGHFPVRLWRSWN